MTVTNGTSISSDILRPHRTPSSFTSPRGINTALVPWRLWEKSKKLFWDPADIDYAADAEQWAAMDDEQRLAVYNVANGFMVGEEAVTLDILPLSLAMADEGRLEEVIFLTSFALEEAKHTDFFRRWFSAVGADMAALGQMAMESAASRGIVFDPGRTVGMWESELPQTMRRLLVDRSPHAVLDAAVTYNQFVEGCLAISGYGLWASLFESLGALPAMQEGIRHIRSDESRHITYGTYLCQRVLAANPHLLGFARDRMYELRDLWFSVNPVDQDSEQLQAVLGRQFRGLVEDQITRRIAVMERAAQMDEAELVASSAAEDAERELIGAD
ncbi:MAG: R2-like ligand-binding oxidase [Acidimicrobiia bacterium]|nr:R2-like ligand-binding oxidase [Acidimicrobiia bacterium]